MFSSWCRCQFIKAIILFFDLLVLACQHATFVGLQYVLRSSVFINLISSHTGHQVTTLVFDWDSFKVRKLFLFHKSMMQAMPLLTITKGDFKSLTIMPMIFTLMISGACELCSQPALRSGKNRNLDCNIPLLFSDTCTQLWGVLAHSTRSRANSVSLLWDDHTRCMEGVSAV